MSNSNVFSAFAEGLEKGDTATSATARAQGASIPATVPIEARQDETLRLVLLLRQLAQAPNGRLPFSLFASEFPGDPVSTLSATVKMMKEGWLEFVGEISPESDIRITDQGRDMVATLERSLAAA